MFAAKLNKNLVALLTIHGTKLHRKNVTFVVVIQLNTFPRFADKWRLLLLYPLVTVVPLLELLLLLLNEIVLVVLHCA